MTTKSRIRLLTSALILGGATIGFSATAQTSTTPMAKEAPAQGTGPVQRAEDATKRAGHATANGARRAGHATANVGRKAAGAVRRTGDKIGSKLPPAPPANPNTPVGEGMK